VQTSCKGRSQGRTLPHPGPFELSVERAATASDGFGGVRPGRRGTGRHELSAKAHIRAGRGLGQGQPDGAADPDLDPHGAPPPAQHGETLLVKFLKRTHRRNVAPDREGRLFPSSASPLSELRRERRSQPFQQPHERGNLPCAELGRVHLVQAAVELLQAWAERASPPRQADPERPAVVRIRAPTEQAGRFHLRCDFRDGALRNARTVAQLAEPEVVLL
jgi:hypothetical protein